MVAQIENFRALDIASSFFLLSQVIENGKLVKIDGILYVDGFPLITETSVVVR